METHRWQIARTLTQALRHLAPALRIVMAVAVVTSTLLAFTAGLSQAAPMAVEPRDIALTTADLPFGFAVDPSMSDTGDIADVGPMYQVGMMREINDMNLLAGPVFVIQQVVRLDKAIGAGDALALQRRYWIEQQGYRPSKAGPNDGGTFSLEKTDESVKVYLIGFIKENMIIVTGVGGLDGVVSYGTLHELASISSARMDRALGR